MKSIPEINFNENQTNGYRIDIMSFAQLSKTEIPKDHNPFMPHQLGFNAILIIGDGKGGKHSIDFKLLEFERNNVLLIAKEQIHNFIDLPKCNHGKLVLFEEGIFLEISNSIPFLIDHFYNYQIYKPKLVLSEKEFTELNILTDKLETELRKEYSGIQREIAKAYLKVMLLKLFEKRTDSYTKDQSKDNLISEFITFQKLLQKHFVLNKKVKFYSKLMNITPQKLNIITSKTVNKSAKSCIIDTIILEAKRYLKGSTLSSKEIAYQLGFDEPTNFTKFFKKHTNTLPSDFANRPI